MDAPAPWRLTGNGFIAALRLPDSVRAAQGGYPCALPPPSGALSYVMFVDYHSSDVGPYHELLFLGGSFRFEDGHRYRSIGRIYVSSEDSVRNGQANWGIPKARADFQVERHGKRTHVTVTRDGTPLARLAFEPLGPALPVTSAVLPRRWLTLAQHWQQHTYYYTPGACGRAGLARAVRLWGDGERFPAVQQGRRVGALAIPRFQMVFPPARITAPRNAPCL